MNLLKYTLIAATVMFVMTVPVLGQDQAVIEATVASKQPTKAPVVVMPYEELNIYDELPDYVYAMSRPMYIKWAKAQNKGAYREAERLADRYRARNPVNPIYVQSNDYKSSVTQIQNESVTPNTANFAGTSDTNYRGNSVQRAYVPQQWQGGPVVLINPYMPRPPRLLYSDQGHPLIADPDRTLDTDEKVLKFLDSLEQ